MEKLSETRAAVVVDRLYEGISSKLPASSDRELLAKLMEIYRKEGKQRLEERIHELVDGFGSET